MSRTLVTLVAAGSLAASAAVLSGQAPQRPDFTGVWTNYVEPGAARGGGPGRGGGPPPAPDRGGPEEGRGLPRPHRREGDTPGGYCLGTGMPGSMLGSGGYPMEILQRPEQINITYEAHNEVRRVYLGDRIVPMADRVPGRNGHSSAPLGRRHAGGRDHAPRGTGRAALRA